MPMIIGKDKSYPKGIGAIIAKMTANMPSENESVDPNEAGLAAAAELINAAQQGDAQGVWKAVKNMVYICESIEDEVG